MIPLANIEQVIFEAAEALRVPVLVLTLGALGLLLGELGAFVVELVRRRRRSFVILQLAASHARASLLDGGDQEAADLWLRRIAWSGAMASTLGFMSREWGSDDASDKMAKALADFDYRSLRKLERTRALVRLGPALGLMGTLIPLSPALAGLADGNVQELSENLRVAFSITVLGLLIGAVAFVISLARDRIYGQDLSDLEYVVNVLERE